MKSINHFLVFSTLSKPLLAQFVPESEARLVAWRAYGDFISQMLTAGQPLVKGRDLIFVTPPNLAAVRGGTPVPESVTNFDLFQLADGLQSQSEPLLDPLGPSYIDALYAYLESVDLGTVKPTNSQLSRIATLEDALHAAQDKLDLESYSAYERYLADPRAQQSKQTFASWVNQRAPLYNQYQRQVQIANANLQSYQISVYGPQYRTLTAQRDKIEFRGGNEFILEPGYNMPVYPQSYIVSLNPWQKNELTDGILYKPLYSLQGGFEEACDAWFNRTTSTTTRYLWSLRNVNGHDWTKLGHSTSVTKFGGSGFYGLFSASRSASKEVTTWDNFTSKYTTAITLELTMEGSPLIFNIGAGYWDVPSARTVYPTLLPTGVDNLKSKVRLSKLLIAHRVGLKITIADTGMWQSVHKFIEDAKKGAGGGFSIFGFRFGAGAGGKTHREINEVKMESKEEGGEIVIPPSPPGITFLLGALGKVQ